VPLLSVENLRTYFHTRSGVYRAVDDVSFTLERGETLGIVGESGSGKSVTCYSLMGLIPQPPGRIESGRALFEGVDLLHCTPAQARAIRGKRISMIFQDPMTSLNPYMRISEQIIEPLLIHEKISRPDALARALAMLEAVGITDAARRMRSYPHEFSGGMRQRVMIAMALITRPDILIADEPTTALDVTVQAQILALIKKMQRELGMAVIFVTHDLAVVSGLCDRVQVMYAGRIVETADTRTLFNSPQHPYTKALQRCIPSLQPKGRELYTIPGLPPDLSKPLTESELLSRFEPAPASTQPLPQTPSDRTAAPVILHLDSVQTHFTVRSGKILERNPAVIRAVDGVSFELKQGEVLGLVGESGSGKSTLARTIMQLVPTTAGTVILEGKNLTKTSADELKVAGRDLQMVFQDPFASLNPRMTVFDTLAEPLLVHKVVPPAEVRARVIELMKNVGLAARFMEKYPHEFSGGQRQRIAIARALALEPKVIIADEPVSALDVSIQAQILNLLASLVRKMNLTLIFISHDLAVVKHISDRIAVMYRGKIVELGPALDVMERPQHEYTRTLLSAIPHVHAS
jgi:oligopeptide/dipeptide ABC transporter ATP-binding protein